MGEVTTYYKWLKPDRTTTYQGVKWPKRVGVWTPDVTPVMCVSGWHLATHEGIAEHARTGSVLWIAEGRGEFVAAGDKVAFSSARLVSQVGTLTQIIAVQWAAECAKRVLRHFEDHHPEDKRPREAIQAALKWAKDPTEANRVRRHRRLQRRLRRRLRRLQRRRRRRRLRRRLRRRHRRRRRRRLRHQRRRLRLRRRQRHRLRRRRRLQRRRLRRLRHRQRHRLRPRRRLQRRRLRRLRHRLRRRRRRG